MNSFNLERAIAAWRRRYAQRRNFLKEDLDELERHLRDHLADLTAAGTDEQTAFHEAVRRLGEVWDAEDEYRKVYGGKLRRRHQRLPELTWRLSMLTNYIKIALRNFKRAPLYPLINVLGLAVGIACCCLIVLYVQDEFSYDRYHSNADRIVRIAEDLKTAHETLYQATSAPAMGPAFVEDFPEVEAMVRFTQTGGLFQHQDRRFQEDNLFFADSTVFDVFSFELLQGDPQTALAAPFTIVLTESAASKYFDAENPLGQTLTDENGNTYTITGILAEIPHHSHFTFDGLISFTTFETFNPRVHELWFWNIFYTYLLLAEDADKAQLEARVPAFIERHTDTDRFKTWYEQLPLIPLTDIHLTSDRIGELAANANRTYLYIFSAVALFVFLIACINFVNLATARSAERAKEVGMRKVVGARRAQLVGQFLHESCLMTVLALVLALGLCWVLMPAFNTLTDKSLTIGLLFQRTNVALLIGAMLLVSVLAGGYLALVLSGFRPIHVLKGPFRAGSQGVWLRKGLVVFQFAISIILIVGTAVVMQQLGYLQARNLGFTQEQMLVINYNADGDVQRHAEAIKQSFLTHPNVVSAAVSASVPGSETYNLFTKVDAGENELRDANLNFYLVDLDFIDTYGLEILAGRGFSRDYPADTLNSIIINEAMLAHFGWASPEEALGQIFDRGRRVLQVIGVVKDFNYRSLHEHVEPLGLFIEPRRTTYLSLRLRTEHLQQSMADIEQQWHGLVPHRPFEAFFLDDYFNRQYQAEERFASLFRYFAGLAILIACLGLFGLATHAAETRTKEIGIRKVLGASVPAIAALLSKDFVKLVAIAFTLAAPLAYLAMHRWLQEFAYHIEISATIFLLAGLAALGIAVLTVSYQAVKAALADPVTSLRYE